MKGALTPPALRWSTEIDIGPFTGRAASGNVILLVHRYPVRHSDFVGHVHTQHRVHVHDETMWGSVV
jgi:hypothetical protein